MRTKIAAVANTVLDNRQKIYAAVAVYSTVAFVNNAIVDRQA